MSFTTSRGSKWRVTTRSLLRLELLIAGALVNLFTLGLYDFGFETYSLTTGYILSFFFVILFGLSFIPKIGNRQIKYGILLLYTVSMILVLIHTIEQNYNRIYYLIFLFLYALFSFVQDKLKPFILISSLLFIIINGSVLIIEHLEMTFILINASFLIVFLAALAITYSRTFLKSKLIRRQNFINDIFNISPDGLVLFDLQNKELLDCNSEFLRLMDIENKKKIIHKDYRQIQLGRKLLFKRIDYERAISLELADHRIINIRFKKLSKQNGDYALGIIKAFKNREELNKSFDFDELIKLSEESYKYLFEESSSLICILDKEGCILDVNETTTGLSGYEKEELIGKKYNVLDSNDEDNEKRERINRIAWSGKKQVVEKAIQSKKGERIDLEVIIQKGKYFGDNALICNSRNISKRKALERELIKNYDKFVALFELSPVGIMVSDLQGNIVDYNGAFIELMEFNKRQLESLTIEDISHPDDLKLHFETRKKILEGKKVSEEIKKRFITANGKELSTILNMVLQHNSEGEPAFFISQLINITDIIQGQKQLEESEKSYRELFNNSSELLYLVDKNDRFVDINQTVIDTYGYSKKELMDSGPGILAAPERNDLEKMKTKADKVWLDGVETEFLFWSRKKSGEHFPKEMHLKKGSYKGKEVLMITARDISESYEYREELEKKEKRYRDLFERNLAGVYRTNLEGRVLECNAAFARVFGYDSNEMLKEKVISKDFYAEPEQREKLIEILNKKGHVEGWQVQLKRRNGKIMMALLNVSKIIEAGEQYFEGNLIDISELTDTQQALKLSQEKYQQLVDHSSFGILILTTKSEIVFANIKAAEILGYGAPKKLLNKKIEEIATSEQIDQLKSVFRELEKSDGSILKEIQVQGNKTTEVDIEMSASSILFENQKAMQLSFVDVSDRKKAEKANEKVKVAETFNKILQAELHEKEEAQKKLIDAQSYTEGIIESSLDMIFTTDLNGNINKLNSAAQKELMAKQEMILNKPLRSILKEKQAAIMVFEQLESKNAFSGEVEMLRSDGSSFPTYLSLSYLFNADGVKLGVLGVSRDISEIKAKELEINEQAAKLTAVIESSSHFFFTVDREYRITSYNHVFESEMIREMGLDFREGDSFFNTLPKKDPSRNAELQTFWKKKFDLAFDGRSSHFEIERKDKKGKVYYRDLYLNPIYLQSDKVEEVSGIGQDITSKKLSEEGLKNSLQEKEVLLKEVHHRVKNNMQVISSILNLQSSYVEDEKVLGILKESQNRIKSMAFIHERLYRTKDFSKLQFSDYVENLCQSLVSTYVERDINVEMKFDLDEIYLNLDSAIPCGLILNELISNSLKYAFVGMVEGVIKISLKEKNNNMILLTVEDNGKGIDEGINIEKTDTLGLQLVHTLTEQLEGKISLYRDKGSRFDIQFSKKI